ncbi:hypothetical protein SDC9_129798 [bioreactor metagenome]|uniref:Uncharacterized protein n=1 Tax=bioreactor metagenome TaxID=1076179 RepID=A0A645CZZ6_9ZZZZ
MSLHNPKPTVNLIGFFKLETSPKNHPEITSLDGPLVLFGFLILSFSVLVTKPLPLVLNWREIKRIQRVVVLKTDNFFEFATTQNSSAFT